nr:polysaccharide deacetylase family protein [Rhodohalobacter sp. SW132]
MPESDHQTATFRVDTDYGSEQSIHQTASVLDEFGVSSTFFLHTEAHENSLSQFEDIKNHEISLHGYRHSEFKTKEQYVSDIRHGLNLLKDHGMDPQGYAAPYGYWSPELASALREFNFQYSSEFGYDYDALPSTPQSSGTLQLPVHPISIGSFSRFNFTEEMIEAYFLEWIRICQLQRKPIHLFYHPNDGHADVLRSIFKQADTHSTKWLTYSQWANWWKKRSSHLLNPVFDTETGNLALNQTGEIPAAVHHDNKMLCTTGSGNIDLDDRRFSVYISPEWIEWINRRRNGRKLSLFRMKKDQLMTSLWRNRS